MHEKRILGNTRFSLSQSVQVAGTAGPVQQGRGDKGQAPCPSAGDMQAGDLMIPAQVGRGAAALALVVQPCPGPWKSLPSHPRFKSLAICCRPVLGRSAISDTGRAGLSHPTVPLGTERRGCRVRKGPSFLALPFRWFPPGTHLLSLAGLARLAWLACPALCPLLSATVLRDGSASHPGIQLWKAVGSMTKSQRFIAATPGWKGWHCSVAGTMGAPHTASRSSCSHHDDGDRSRSLCAAIRACAFASAAAAGPSTRRPGK